MDTVSLPVFHHVRVDRRSMLLVVALVSIALVLLAAGGLDLDLPSPHQDDDPLLAPFRWWASNRNVA